MSTKFVLDAKHWVVLIVDDMPDNLMVAELALKFHGAQVLKATNGEEGLAVLRQVQPTVILLDIRMPTMDGWKMFEILRASPETAHIPVIAVTAYAMDSDRDRVFAAGFDGYLSKPFNVVTFVADIADVLTSVKQADLESKGNTK